MKSLKEQLVNEDNFGYTWQNAFITTICTLISKGGEDQALEILKKWFNDEDDIRKITTFLYQIGYDMSAIGIGNSPKRTPENVLKLLKKVKITKNMSIGYPNE